MPDRYHYRPQLCLESFGGLPADLDWGYAETPATALRGRPGILPSRYDYGVIWIARMLTRDECQRLSLVPHKVMEMA